MFDVVLAVEVKARLDLSTSLPGPPAITVPLYVGLRVDATASPPYGWLRESSESPFQPVPGMWEDLVYLDLYARSSGELQRMENAMVFLDDYGAAPFGNALRIRYKVQSKTRITEAEGTVHGTHLYAARYADKRKLAGVMPV
ncbi:MAG: hypothetical protein WKF67_07815 [Rubrobacteraceae bacterium]